LIADGKIRGDVLDAGCGYAELSLAIAALGVTVVGIELTPTAVSAAREAAEERGLSTATFVQDDISTFTGFDGRYRAIDEVRPAFIHANMPSIPGIPAPSFDRDGQGRMKMPAYLLTAHKAP
jgi:SAM-dependent methyltransferase